MLNQSSIDNQFGSLLNQSMQRPDGPRPMTAPHPSD
jgi:hypothetical protein